MLFKKQLTIACLAAVGLLSIFGRYNPAHAQTPIDAGTVEAWSKKFLGWHYYPDHVIRPNPGIKGYDKVRMVDCPTVFQIPGDEKWYMTYIGFDGRGYQSFLASSDDLVRWTQLGLAMGYGPKGHFDHGGVVLGAYLYESYDLDAPRILKKHNGKYWSLYGAYPRQGRLRVAARLRRRRIERQRPQLEMRQKRPHPLRASTRLWRMGKRLYLPTVARRTQWQILRLLQRGQRKHRTNGPGVFRRPAKLVAKSRKPGPQEPSGRVRFAVLLGPQGLPRRRPLDNVVFRRRATRSSEHRSSSHHGGVLS